MIAANTDHNKRIADWFCDICTSSGRSQKEIARMLDLSDSAISRIKAQKQSLSATQLLILYEEFKRPLPTLFTSASEVHEPEPRTGTSTTALFDIAYDQVRALNEDTPDAEKMSQAEMLETVFHAMRRLATSRK